MYKKILLALVVLVAVLFTFNTASAAPPTPPCTPFPSCLIPPPPCTPFPACLIPPPPVDPGPPCSPLPECLDPGPPEDPGEACDGPAAEHNPLCNDDGPGNACDTPAAEHNPHCDEPGGDPDGPGDTPGGGGGSFFAAHQSGPFCNSATLVGNTLTFNSSPIGNWAYGWWTMSPVASVVVINDSMPDGWMAYSHLAMWNGDNSYSVVVPGWMMTHDTLVTVTDRAGEVAQCESVAIP